MTRREMMKKRINILAVLMIVWAMVAPLSAPMPVYAQDARTLTTMDFYAILKGLLICPLVKSNSRII